MGLYRGSTFRWARLQQIPDRFYSPVAFARAMSHHDQMNCRLVREALSARIDGEREPASVRSVDKHLVGCSDCRLWYTRAVGNAEYLQNLGHTGGLRSRSAVAVVEQSVEKRPPARALQIVLWPRWSLALVGV